MNAVSLQPSRNIVDGFHHFASNFVQAEFFPFQSEYGIKTSPICVIDLNLSGNTCILINYQLRTYFDAKFDDLLC